MRRMTLVPAILMGAVLVTALPASAAALTTADGVLSIEAPTDNWAVVTDPNHWFVITDGKNTITAEHLSNGENLPVTEIADAAYPAVYQAFVSTTDEVFVLKGQAATEEELATVMEAIGTVRVLKYKTKTAIPKETEAAAASEFSMRLINATYYVTTDELNVRNGCSTDEAVIGTLHYGDEVTVSGAVTRGGTDYGWYQVQFNGGAAYVSAGFLSDTKPAEQTASKDTGKKSVGSGFSVYREDGSYIGELVPYDDGQYYINEIPFRSNGDGSFFGGAGAGMTVYNYEAWDKLFNVSNLVQCEYCGNWFHTGNDYRNHVMAAHGSGSGEDVISCDICGATFQSWDDYHAHVRTVNGENSSGQENVQCEYCGEWFTAGTDYRNHVMAAHGSDSGQDVISCDICGATFQSWDDYHAHVSAVHGENPSGQENVQCEYCGEWFLAGTDYRNHVMAAHGISVE